MAGTAIITNFLGQNAQAAFVMNIEQVGADVVGTGSGTLNLTGLNQQGADLGGLVYAGFPFGSLLALGQTENASLYTTIHGPTWFGSGGQFLADSNSGDLVGVIANDGVYVPSGYVSGAALSDTSTWNSTTIAGLDLTPGTYTWTWGTGANADSLTLNIASVPEPSTYLAGATLLLQQGVIAFRMLRKRQAA